MKELGKKVDVRCSWRELCKSEIFGRKNVAEILLGEKNVGHIYPLDRHHYLKSRNIQRS